MCSWFFDSHVQYLYSTCVYIFVMVCYTHRSNIIVHVYVMVVGNLAEDMRKVME